MHLKAPIYTVILLTVSDYCWSQTSPANVPPCIDYPDSLHCFQSFAKTSGFTVAMETCHNNKMELPIIATKSERQDAIVKSLSRVVPLWLDLRSLTRVEVSHDGRTVKYGICGVGKNQYAPQMNNVSFDYCFNKRRTLCCTNLLVCHKTDVALTWEEAKYECEKNNKKMYGIGATFAEIRTRFQFIAECSECWVGLNVTATSTGYSDDGLVLSSFGLESVPKPGPCAVLDHNGNGVNVKCEGQNNYSIICETYVQKHLVSGDDGQSKYDCPPEGCVKPYPRGGNIKVVTAITVLVGFPVFVGIGLVIGIIHRKKNPIYNPLPETRQTRRMSSYIPGGSNTQF